ncbi:hypothetical protein GHT06_021462 [Daphnia sinensis]|uniref:Poly(A) RNA polymerase mitochondrial-like central palm domain-containing protein n=1 Tax=Daphnia sinensis TaxID=1820382 RepID=A0AAD5PQU8_9CRUS|nr:hypothetical protein GHT06_021462 [Daphnia sinensis]
MRYSFVHTSHHIRPYLHKVKLKFDAFRHVRTFSTADKPTVVEETTKTYPSTNDQKQCFDEMVECRKKEARSSVVVQVGNPSKSAALVNQVCSRHGNVANLFHYTHKDKELLLLEFDSELSAVNLLASCSHNNNVKVIPAASPFLWLKAMPSESSASVSARFPPVIREENLANDNLEDLLSNAKSISEQMIILEDQTRLSEIGHRLRWITCVQIERMLSGLFPSLQVLPFGSFVNGCGRNGCDLDMAVSLDGNCGSEPLEVKSPLIFQAKAAINNPRLQTQRHIEVFADILQNFTTGCTQVQRILQARVPIVKFYHEFTGVDCDLSMGSLTGVFMSELLYLYDKIDWRFRPLVTAVRHWGAWARLTDMVPGPRITNFTLTLMVVFFMQRRSPAILPTLGEMIKLARPQVDTRQTNDVDCTFLRDPSMFQERGKLNEESLEDLFIEFLRFIESFDFNERSVSIITGTALRKFDSKPLYVQNPLERELNVSRNVNLKELTRVVMEARNALYILETQEDQGPANWGLLALPRAERVRRLNPKTSHYNYVTQIDMKDLFSNDTDDEIDDLVEVKLSKSEVNPQTTSPFAAAHNQTKPAATESRPVSSLNAMNGFIKQVQLNTGLAVNSPKNLPLKSEKNRKAIEKQKRK